MGYAQPGANLKKLHVQFKHSLIVIHAAFSVPTLNRANDQVNYKGNLLAFVDSTNETHERDCMSFKFLRSILVVVSAIAAAGLFVAPALPQVGKGTINGRVVDDSGGALQGAKVVLQPSGVTAATNDQGEFNISDLSAGEYTVNISYVGFDNFSKVVTVTAAQTLIIDVELKEAAQNQQIIVTAEHGEAEAINRERTADNILQVTPEEVITSLPNANIADAVGRLPGVTLERDEGEGKYIQVRSLEPSLSK